MKEFALKHPILTFLLVDSLGTGVINLIKYGIAAFVKNEVIEISKDDLKKAREEEMMDEPACDIQ